MNIQVTISVIFPDNNVIINWKIKLIIQSVNSNLEWVLLRYYIGLFATIFAKDRYLHFGKIKKDSVEF